MSPSDSSPPTNSPEAHSHLIKTKALELGFHLCGITTTLSEKQIQFHEWWVNQGFGADMFFLKTQRKKRKSLEAILPGARSAIVCALRFPGKKENSALQSDLSENTLQGKVARYALHEDYHSTLLPKLESLAKFVDDICNTQDSLAYVDTGPISERALAAASGLGWIGKNSMLIHPEEGSWFWLGEIISRASLTVDKPLADRCGKCTRCIDACPTGAIFEEIRAIDSRKCLAYWNIEHRGPIPPHLHKPMGEWLIGCDICQEVCPWNKQSLRTARSNIGEPPIEQVNIEKALQEDKEAFLKQYKRRAISRAKYEGWQRNARIVKNNAGSLKKK